MFSFCPTNFPQYHPRTAERLVDDWRRTTPDAIAVPCPWNPRDHWHALSDRDNEMWRAHEARVARVNAKKPPATPLRQGGAGGSVRLQRRAM